MDSVKKDRGAVPRARRERRWPWLAVGPAFLCAVVILLGGAGEKAPATTPSGGVDRDWTQFPAVVQMQTAGVIYDVADMHGDFEKATRLLAGAGLIEPGAKQPADVRWKAGKNTLVCTGDMVDKGPASIEVAQMMRALQKDAAGKGGTVIVTLGNHEADFLAGKGDKKSGDFFKELQARGIAPADVVAGKDALGLGEWLRTRPVAAKVDDWFFCHAGDTQGMSADEIEAAVEKGVSKEGFGTFVLAQPNSILQAPMGGEPWWLLADAGDVPLPTGVSKDAEKWAPGAVRLHAYAAALGCAHIVVGHHPSKVTFGGNAERPAGEPFCYDGVLFLMDTGMSRGVADGKGAVLKIEPGAKERASWLNESGKEKELWNGK